MYAEHAAVWNECADVFVRCGQTRVCSVDNLEQEIDAICDVEIRVIVHLHIVSGRFMHIERVIFAPRRKWAYVGRIGCESTAPNLN